MRQLDQDDAQPLGPPIRRSTSSMKIIITFVLTAWAGIAWATQAARDALAGCCTLVVVT